MLNNLIQFLYQNNLLKEAQQVENLQEYAEPWHEEAVNEFGSEPISEEDYFKQNFQDNENPYLNDVRKKILEKHNFQIFLDENTLLGTGAFGRVFKGVYQGKPAVAKIIVKNYGIPQQVADMAYKEAKVWNQILQAKQSLPPDLQSFIPTI